MTRKVPFYPNHPDGTHCYQASIKMALKYFCPEKEFSWQELDRMTAKKKGFWTWPMQGLLNLKKMGFEIVYKEDFDYESFSKRGGQYLIKRFGEEVGKAQIKHGHLPQERKIAEEFIKVFDKKSQRASLSDVKKLLKKGYLVICNLNSRTLNNKKGYVGHFVLVFDFDKDSFYLHDPGRPPKENKRVSFRKFIRAWAYSSPRDKNLIALRLK